MLYIYYDNAIYSYLAGNLKKQIQECGIDIDITSSISEFNTNDLYIIFGMHDFHSPVVPRNYIIYQLEQSSGNETSNYFNQKYIDYMKKARSVWDYSLINYQYLETIGIKAEYKPVYPVQYRHGNQEDKEDIVNDFIFVGVVNDRRAKIIDELRNAGYSVFVPSGLYGDAFASALKKSKFALNIHYFDKSILETVRLSTLIEYGCKIITEKSIDPVLDMDYSIRGVTLTTYDNFVSKAIESIKEFHFETFETPVFKKTDYSESLRRYDYLFSGEKKEEDIPFVIECTCTCTSHTSVENTLSLFVPVINDDDLPKISIVTPTYNRSNIFQLAVKNFRDIAYPKHKIEWIIVNDSDKKEMNKYKIPKESNIAHYKLETTGRLTIGHKRNFGVERSSGDYVVFMDDDDYYYPDSVYNRIALMLYY